MNAIAEEAQSTLLGRRKLLLRVQRELVRNEGALGDARQSSPRDEAGVVEEIDVIDRLSRAEVREIHEIDEALLRVASGSYGRCESCSGAMGRQRLRAMPEARLCASCQTLGEKGAEP